MRFILSSSTRRSDAVLVRDLMRRLHYGKSDLLHDMNGIGNGTGRGTGNEGGKQGKRKRGAKGTKRYAASVLAWYESSQLITGLTVL